jgi:heme oxygenase
VIDGLLVDMQQRGVHWKGFLDKLAVINMAHHQVRPAAAAAVVHVAAAASSLGFRQTFVINLMLS